MTMKRGAWGPRWGEGARLADDSDIRLGATAWRSLFGLTPDEPESTGGIIARVVRGREAAEIRLEFCEISG